MADSAFEVNTPNLAAFNAALSPLASSTLTATRTSLTVSNDTWPAYRADAQILAVPDLVEALA